jgi:hypothetical protein
MSYYLQKKSRIVSCSICKKEISTSNAFDQWDAYFCSAKCKDVRGIEELKKKKEAEAEEIARLKTIPNFENFSGGSGECF